MTFAKQKWLKPGRKGLRLSPPTLVRVAREGKAARLLYLLLERRAGTLLRVSLAVLRWWQARFHCPRAVCRPGQGSGREPGLDLQGQLVQGVLVDDEGLVQQVVSDLEGGTQMDRLHVTATEISQLSFSFSVFLVLRLPCVVSLRKPAAARNAAGNEDAPAAL